MVTLVNFIPGVAVINLPPIIPLATITSLLLGAVAGAACCMALLIEPQKTFTDTMLVGSMDPIRAAAGCFFFVGFMFMAAVSFGVLVRLPAISPSWTRICKARPGWLLRMCNAIEKPRAIAFVILFVILG